MTETTTPPAPDFSERDKLQRDLQAASQRRTDQEAAVFRLRQAADDAQGAVDAALRAVAAGGNQLALTDARVEQRGAEEALKQGLELLDAMTLHVTETQAAITAAHKQAQKPILQHAARESIAACEDFASALAALRAAVARKIAANTLAHRTGARPFDGALLEPRAIHPGTQPAEFGQVLATPAEEREIWAEVL